MRHKQIYRIEFDNLSKLRSVWSINFPFWRGIVVAIIALICVLLLAGALIISTPLKRMLPGYLKASQRDNTIEALMMCDSLQMVYDANQRYIDNLKEIFDTERTPSDSITAAKAALPMSADSLMDSSAEETKFVKMMEEREKYNISILAPLAADAMSMSDISQGFTLSRASGNSFKAEVIIPASAPIFSISDGIVIDLHYSPAERGYSLLLQHDKGFASKYSGLSRPLVRKGEKLYSGQILGNGSANGTSFFMELWRNGSPLRPADYIKSSSREKSDEPIVDVEVGRGR